MQRGKVVTGNSPLVLLPPMDAQRKEHQSFRVSPQDSFSRMQTLVNADDGRSRAKRKKGVEQHRCQKGVYIESTKKKTFDRSGLIGEGQKKRETKDKHTIT